MTEPKDKLKPEPPAPPPARWRLRFRDKPVLSFGAVVIASTVLALWLCYTVSVRLLIEEFGKTLIAVANIAATGIDGDQFQTLRDPKQVNSSAYSSVYSHLYDANRVAKESHIGLKFLEVSNETKRN